LSCLVLSWSCLVLSCLVLSCLVLSLVSCLVLVSCPVLSCLVLAWLVYMFILPGNSHLNFCIFDHSHVERDRLHIMEPALYLRLQPYEIEAVSADVRQLMASSSGSSASVISEFEEGLFDVGKELAKDPDIQQKVMHQIAARFRKSKRLAEVLVLSSFRPPFV
jgi:hypothetical protein